MGCWDGSVALWRLQPAEILHPAKPNGHHPPPATPVLLVHSQAEALPLRTVAWAPAGLANSAPGGLGRHVFLTAGHSGSICIWDAR